MLSPLRFFSGSSVYEKNGSIQQWSYLSYPRPFGPHVHSQLGRRVMDLSRSYSLSSDDISRGIEQLVHLRYLAVRHKQLPSIENFHKLEYLLVKNKEEVGIPEIVLNMMKLKHMHFRGGAYVSESFYSRATKDGSFPLNLKSISLLVIHNEMDAKVMGCAPNLCRLKCKITSQCPFQFPNQLESLNIGLMRDSGPNFPLNLKKLTLCEFNLSWEKVRVIGRLPYLEVLKLRYDIFNERQWDTEEGEFQKLKFFELNNVRAFCWYEIAKWNPERDDYPELERLVLRNCYCLQKIPSSLGYIPTLQMIEVYGGKQSIAKSAMEILKEQREEMGNEELKVIISH